MTTWAPIIYKVLRGGVLGLSLSRGLKDEVLESFRNSQVINHPHVVRVFQTKTQLSDPAGVLDVHSENRLESLSTRAYRFLSNDSKQSLETLVRSFVTMVSGNERDKLAFEIGVMFSMDLLDHEDLKAYLLQITTGSQRLARQSSLSLDNQIWEIKRHSALTTREIYCGLFDNTLDANLNCRCTDFPDWQKLSSRFHIHGHFGTLRFLGSGSFGQVFLALDLKKARNSSNNRLAALKFLSKSYLQRLANLTGDSLTEARLKFGQAASEEVALTARLADCANVVKIYWHDVRIPAIAFEYCDGDSLAIRMRSSYQLSEALTWLYEIATALKAAHELRPDYLVHRDLKPDNVLLSNGRVKVADFGTSRLLSETRQKLSKDGGYTPSYAAPEAYDQEATPATDVWSWGVMLYELLSGYLPFTGRTERNLMFAILRKDPRPFKAKFDWSIPSEILKLMNRCLDKDQENRPTADECLTVIKSVLTRESDTSFQYAETKAEESLSEGELNALQIRVDKLEKDRRSLLNQWTLEVEVLKKQLQDSRKELTRECENSEELKSLNARLQTQLAELEQESESTRKELGNKSRTIQKLNEELILAQETLSQNRLLNNDLQRQRNVIHELETEVSELEKKRSVEFSNYKFVWAKYVKTRFPIGHCVKAQIKIITGNNAMVELEEGVPGALSLTDSKAMRSLQRRYDARELVFVKVQALETDRLFVELSLADFSQYSKQYYPISARVSATVKSVTESEALLAFEDDVEAVIFGEDLTWNKRVYDCTEKLRAGQFIQAIVLEHLEKSSRIRLGIKQLVEDPWETVESNYKVGSKVTGKIIVLLHYGIIVEFEDGVEGLVLLEDLSWTKHLEYPEEIVEVGKQIDLVVLKVDRRKQELRLGARQITEDPWLRLIPNKYKVGEIISSSVVRLSSSYAYLKLDFDLEGMIHITELSDFWIKDPGEKVSIGDQVRAKILVVSKEERIVKLSLKQVESRLYLPSPNVKNKETLDRENPQLTLELIKSYVWKRYIDNVSKYPDVDDEEAARRFELHYSKHPINEDHDCFYFGVLLFELAWTTADEEKMKRLIFRSMAVLELYRKQSGEDDWDVIEDRLEECRDFIAENNLRQSDYLDWTLN